MPISFYFSFGTEIDDTEWPCVANSCYLWHSTKHCSNSFSKWYYDHQRMSTKCLTWSVMKFVVACALLQKTRHRVCIPGSRCSLQWGIHIVHFHSPRVATCRNWQLSSVPPNSGFCCLIQHSVYVNMGFIKLRLLENCLKQLTYTKDWKSVDRFDWHFWKACAYPSLFLTHFSSLWKITVNDPLYWYTPHFFCRGIYKLCSSYSWWISVLLCAFLQTCMGKDITLHVSASNPAMLLYQKFGFKAEELVLDFYDKYLPAESTECRHAYFLRLRRWCLTHYWWH